MSYRLITIYPMENSWERHNLTLWCFYHQQYKVGPRLTIATVNWGPYQSNTYGLWQQSQQNNYT